MTTETARGIRRLRVSVGLLAYWLIRCDDEAHYVRSFGLPADARIVEIVHRPGEAFAYLRIDSAEWCPLDGGHELMLPDIRIGTCPVARGR